MRVSCESRLLLLTVAVCAVVLLLTLRIAPQLPSARHDIRDGVVLSDSPAAVRHVAALRISFPPSEVRHPARVR